MSLPEQLLTQKNILFSTKLTLLEDEALIDDYIKKEKQKLLLKQQEEQARLRASCTIASGALRLFADLQTKSLRLYYKDKEITKLSGLHISFLFNQAWYDTSSCDWQVEKQGDTLILNLNWKELQFSSTCKFCLKDNSLLWQADFKSPDSLNLGLLKFGLSVIPEYKSFFAAHQQRDFPSEFISWQDMTLEEPRAEWFGLRKQAQLPGIILENSQNFSCLIPVSYTHLTLPTKA